MTDLDYRVYWLNRLGIVEDEEDPDVVLAFEFWFDADERNLFESIDAEVLAEILLEWIRILRAFRREQRS